MIKLNLVLLLLVFCLGAWGQQRPHRLTAGEWPEYGGTLAGQRYSNATEISRQSVKQLKIAWVYHTHTFDRISSINDARSVFESTPVLWQGTLYFTSPYNEVFAIDASSGSLRWKFDPQVNRDAVSGVVASRGVALWHSNQPVSGECHDAVLLATLDRRLIARDAGTGESCRQFGVQGTVDLTKGIQLDDPKYLSFTSPPIVVGQTIVLGSSVADNQKYFAGSGAVRGFDVRSGRQLWSWEPLRETKGRGGTMIGSANAWAPLAADPEHDLVFVPTSSPSLDYFGGNRIGDDRDADSIVALRASTGQKVWAFQLVHHNLWDYDTASQPLLFEFRNNVPAVAVTNKTGMIYVFNRLTGEPLYPIVEKPVPQSDVPGEATWPTQPFSMLPSLTPIQYSLRDVRQNDSTDSLFCNDAWTHYRYDGLFTPPSEEGSILYPASLGGPNWGSSAFDPATGILYTRTTSLPYVLRLKPRAGKLPGKARDAWERTAPIGLGGDPMAQRLRGANPFRPPDLGSSADMSLMTGSPFTMDLRAFVAPSGIPCGPQPYGRLVATDLNRGKQLWSVPHGSMGHGESGSVGTAGPLVTAGGLVFVAGTMDPYLRAYDATTGAELWRSELPGPANATPMSYTIKGKQFVVIGVGGTFWGGVSGAATTKREDTVIAFALPEKSE